VVTALAGVGCSGSRDGQTARLMPSPKPYESDIPIPQGFKIVERAMEDHSTGQARTYLRHSYVGGDDKFAVRNFYREQMPLNRWALVSDSALKGDFNMRFAKANESCVVNIADEGSVIGKKTTVQVMISPEKRGAKAPAARNQR
jgi:hypothetical protein